MIHADRLPFAQRRIALPVIMAAVALVAIPAGAVLAQQQGEAPFTVVETGRGYTRLQDAVNDVGGRKATISIAPGRYAQCAVQEAGEITYAAAQPGAAIFDGVACEGKAALVLRGRSAQVVGLIFQNIRVPDFNGAGIRLEKGDLTIAQSWFRDSEQGLLAGDNEQGRIIIDKSSFTRLGTCDGPGGCAHGLYVGDYGTLRVTRSRFEAGRGGHYLKTRSARVEIASCSFDDTKGKATNYMIDLSNGATGQITNNLFVQGADKENHSAFITVAPEGQNHSAKGLQISGNDARFAPGVSWTSTFVANWTNDPLAIGANTLGPGIKRDDKR